MLQDIKRHTDLTTACSLSSSCAAWFLTTSINRWPWKQSNKHQLLSVESWERTDSHRLFFLCVGLLSITWLQAISLSVSFYGWHKCVHHAGGLLSDLACHVWPTMILPCFGLIKPLNFIWVLVSAGKCLSCDEELWLCVTSVAPAGLFSHAHCWATGSIIVCAAQAHTYDFTARL